MRSITQPDHDIMIVGAGFSGLGAGIRLKSKGIEDFVIVESGDDVGGTWRINHYPGVALDIPGFCYTYEFEPSADWTEVFAPGRDVLRYAHHCVTKYGLQRHLRLSHTVERAEFDDDQHIWNVTFTSGARASARFLVCCHGVLNTAQKPDIPGIDSFCGKTITAAQWDHSYDLTGNTAAVIGTGATGIQVVSNLAPRVAALKVFQRTPIFVLPKPNFAIAESRRRMLATVPWLTRAVRSLTLAMSEAVLTVGILRARQLPFILKTLGMLANTYLRVAVKDPVIRHKLKPTYDFGCKRPSFSNTYLQCFNRPNVELITESIAAVTAHAIRTADGREVPIDLLVLATGYKPLDVPYVLQGTDGLALGDRWSKQRKLAFEGVSVRNYPNMFMSPGPLGLSGGSWFGNINTCTTHLLRVICEVKRRGATKVEISENAVQRYERDEYRRIDNTAFVGAGCAGSNTFWVDEHGDPSLFRPRLGAVGLRRQKTFDLDSYEYSNIGHTPQNPPDEQGRLN